VLNSIVSRETPYQKNLPVRNLSVLVSSADKNAARVFRFRISDDMYRCSWKGVGASKGRPSRFRSITHNHNSGEPLFLAAPQFMVYHSHLLRPCATLALLRCLKTCHRRAQAQPRWYHEFIARRREKKRLPNHGRVYKCTSHYIEVYKRVTTPQTHTMCLIQKIMGARAKGDTRRSGKGTCVPERRVFCRERTTSSRVGA
jgi:hypothetical protein